MPDTFFRNEKIGAFHNILTPNLYIRVFPDGDVLYSIRISLTCFCSMYLALFPLDEQTCNLDIASCKFAKICQCLQIFCSCLNAFKINTKICLRWLGKERCWVYMERWESCSTSEQPLSTRRIQTWSIWKRELWCCNINWWVLIF